MQAARDLEMRRATVWSMMHRIRAAMVDDGDLLRGLVEGHALPGLPITNVSISTPLEFHMISNLFLNPI